MFKQTVVRYLDPWHHYKPFYYFPRVFLTQFLPWTPLFLIAIPWRKASRAALTHKQRFAWAVVLFTLLFFSLSRGKRDLYILYRSAYRFYGIRSIVELADENGLPNPSLPRLEAFWREHPEGWVIIREHDLARYRKNQPEPLIVHLNMPVGRGQIYLLVSRTKAITISELLLGF